MYVYAPVLRRITGVCLYDSHSVKNVPGVWAGGELSSRKRPSWHLNSDLCCDPWEEQGASEDMPVSQRDSYDTAGAKNTHWHTHKENTMKQLCKHKYTYIMHTKTYIYNINNTHTLGTAGRTHEECWTHFLLLSYCVCVQICFHYLVRLKYPHRNHEFMIVWTCSIKITSSVKSG